MMSICPKCGAYYAAGSSAFCLADGAPLVNMDPKSDNWSEASRVLEEEGKELRKQRRRLKWRRVLMTSMTMMIATMVVCVVAVNGWIYLTPAPAKPQPSPSPSVTPSPLLWPAPMEIPLTIPSPTPSPRSSPSPSPRPSPRRNVNSNTNSNTNSNANSNANSNVNSNVNANISANANSIVNANANSIVNANTNSNGNATTNSNANSNCSDADKSREIDAIKQVIPRTLRMEVVGPVVTGSIMDDMQVYFVKPCTAAIVTVTYEWQGDNKVSRSGSLRKNQKQKVFDCKKVGTWSCRPR